MHNLCILFFGILHHLYARISTTVLWGDIASRKDDLWAPLGAPRFSLFSCKSCNLVIPSCKATREARGGARRMTVHHSYLKRAFSEKRALRIIVTVICSCKTTRMARGGARKMTVHDGISVSCLVLDEAIIINLT
jgi:hypothetical protein